ncbi:MAG: hypothetical protein ACKVWV_02445 [Planctomycetota bacterium]
MVRSEDGTDFGKTRVVVIAAHSAREAYVVLETDGVLGLGEREYALPQRTLAVVTNEQSRAEKRTSSTTWNEERCKHHGVPFFRNARRSGGCVH